MYVILLFLALDVYVIFNFFNALYCTCIAINIHFMYACDVFVIFCVYRDIIHIVNMRSHDI